MLTNSYSKQTGFTLIETFVAISILMIAVLIPLSVLSKAIEDGLFIKNRVTATYLAQEGMELVVNKIQSNILGASIDTDWLDGISLCVGASCVIDMIDPQDYSFSFCGTSDPSCGQLFQDTINGQFKSAGGNKSIFKRRIVIGNAIIGSDGLAVAIPIQVEVRWHNKPTSPEQSLILNDFIYRTINDF